MPHRDIRLRAAHGPAGPLGSAAPHIPLTPADRAELARLAQIIDFKTPGSPIYAQGDPASYSFLLAAGLVRVSHTLANGERQIVAFHWPGDLFGLTFEGRYVNAAETIGPAKLYRFPMAKLTAFLLQNPRVQDGFLVKTVHDLRAAQRQLVILGRLDIPRRLAAFLLDCTAHERYFDPASAVLTLPMTRADIADYLGTSTETVTRALARLEAEGLLRRLTARKLALAPAALQSFAAVV